MALKDRMWIILVLGLVGLFGRKVTATPGRVGCFYDLQLCESNELCYNDSLFGTCVAQLTDAVSYADLSPAALSEAARVLQYLIETGYKWPDSYTQCVVGKYLQSAVTNEPYDPQVCEYLKQILTVIDQARNDPAAAAPTFPQSTDVQVPVEPLSHGEFMSKTDGKADFDVPLMDAAPSAVVTDTSAVAPINIDDAASYAALQQYLQTLAQQQPEVPVNVEKKSGPTEATTAAPEVTPATPTTNISDQALQSDAQAFDNLFAFLTAANADSQVAVAPQTSELTAVPMDVPEVVASDQQPMPMRVPFGPEMSSQEFQGFPGGAQFVPDFSARPPPGMFNNLDEMLLAQQMVAAQFAPQNMPQIDPRMLMDPTMMQSQMDPRMMDPRMMAQIDPRIMARMDPQMMQMDPRMMAQMDPRMMGQMDPRMMSQIDPRMLDPRMMAQMDPRMMAQLDPRMMPQMDPRMMDPRLSMPQVLPDQFPFAPMPTKRGDFMAVPPMDLFYQRQPPMFSPQMMDQRMFDPMFMPPQMPPMDMFTGFPQPPMDPSQWAGNQLQMSLPAGFAVIEPVLVDTNTSDEAIKRLFAESGEQSGDAGNGSEGPSAQSKKDQEYKSLLPSNENLQSEVVEDVTVKIVKGSLPDTVVPPTDTQIKGEAHEDDEYVFLMTEPQLSYEEARFLLNWLRAVLSLPVQTFYDLSVTDALLTFRINPALQNLNATYIAQTFGDDELRSAIRGANGLEIKRAGVGHYRLVEAPGEDMPLMQFEPTAVVESMEPAAAVTAAVSKADKEMARKYDVLDPTMAFIVTDPPLDYKKAKELLIWLAGQLQVPPTIFTDLHIEGNQLVFRVSSLFDRINASRVVEHLSGSAIQSALRQQFDVEIIRTGIGDKVQVVKADLKQRQNLLIGLIAVACVAAILITLGIIYFVRRNLLIKKKLQGLGGDVESSKEYEELCRQRMATKNLEAAGPKPTVQRTPERDRAAHNSTSSWSEEPAPTNMDLTTGHMVLSYMEDHLKHKERLNEEWASLCTYEADPKQTDAAGHKENLIKNRYPDVLPYDHTRVKLNPEANVTKSDYINANLITDADPKNAAYIATQGPLPDTVSDFWQMVWESSSTVIVMLTRLRENDAELCHVYWPKEGSEVYQHYEVHLVSEHIWCDDYLVRNFYLKNLRTHETRTVTQFHYLNWPNLGVPTSLKTFLEFRRKINKCYKGGPSPIVIVCSDGVDRTGAYCLIDLVLNRMAKGVKEIDIAATLEHLRDQRMDMVRTKEQFEFVLTAVAQEIQAILKSMPQK